MRTLHFTTENLQKEIENGDYDSETQDFLKTILTSRTVAATESLMNLVKKRFSGIININSIGYKVKLYTPPETDLIFRTKFLFLEPCFIKDGISEL
jgi:hypothetical protein